MAPGIDRVTFALPVLLETAHEIAVVKPSGMATELTRDPKGVSLIARVRDAAPVGAIPQLPHRLDRVSRGIVVVALTNDAIAYHHRQIEQRRWDKIYLARCLAPEGEDLGSLLGRHKVHLRPQGGRARVVHSGGQAAVTEVLEVASAPSCDGEIHALVRLQTGRFHQIRATLAHLGAPLVDDWIYGSSPGRRKERFYLEHIALRWTPFSWQRPCILHWIGDPAREPVDGAIHRCLDRVILRWDNEGAVHAGGIDG